MEVVVRCESVRLPPPNFFSNMAVGDEVEVRTTSITGDSLNSGLVVVVYLILCPLSHRFSPGSIMGNHLAGGWHGSKQLRER